MESLGRTCLGFRVESVQQDQCSVTEIEERSVTWKLVSKNYSPFEISPKGIMEMHTNIYDLGHVETVYISKNGELVKL